MASTEKPYFYQSADVIDTEVDLDNQDHVALATYLVNNQDDLDYKVVRRLMNKAGLAGSPRDIWVLDRDTTTGQITCHYNRADTTFYESNLCLLVDPASTFLLR